MSRGLYERLCDIKERCEQLVEDLQGDTASLANNRVLAKAVLLRIPTNPNTGSG